jgi:hypothetical protein
MDEKEKKELEMAFKEHEVDEAIEIIRKETLPEYCKKKGIEVDKAIEYLMGY